MDTIFALSTPAGKSGIAVVRVSGPSAFDLCRALVGDVPEPRHAALRTLTSDGVMIDQAVVLCFAGGESFTGEKTVEFQIHGSISVVNSICDACAAFPDVRPADPGEFTRRALENDRLDLAQVEGLADLLDAETEAQRRQALRVLSGALGERCEDWRTKLIRAMALLEVTIDFADEEVPETVFPEVSDLISAVISDLETEIAGVAFAERVRAGFEVAIIGAPNVGKSTLLNALAGREAAITSEYAGTTRDIIEVRMDLGGYPVTILDTAGLRDTDDHVEKIGVQRAMDRAKTADLRVFLYKAEGELSDLLGPDDIALRAKCDVNPSDGSGISGKTGAGVTDLVEAITARLRHAGASAGIATRLRHRSAMAAGLEALKGAQQLLALPEPDTELLSEDIRSALHALNALVGRVDVENILDEIFSSFCLGK